jgi:DNA gyrase subunit A
VITASRSGTVKKTALSEYSRPRATGIIGAGIDEGDEIIAAQLTTDENDILLGTKKGMAIRFKASDVRSMGRPSVGVRGIRLDEKDEVVGMAVLDSGATILSVTERGYGKRTKTEEYRPQQRGGRGIILIKTSDRNGPVVGLRQVVDDNHIMIITKVGVVIRMLCSDISIMGRNTQGVRLVRVTEEDTVGALCNLEEVDESEMARPVESADGVEEPVTGDVDPLGAGDVDEDGASGEDDGDADEGDAGEGDAGDAGEDEGDA